jgi:dihydrofolate reductase
MITSIISAVAKNMAIGKGNDLPWKLSSDLKYFKEKTLGHAIIMGKKTFDSIGKALPGRKNIIISRPEENFSLPDIMVVNSIPEALLEAEKGGETEAFIIGGASIYAQAISLVDKLYITEVEAVIDGDKFFPVIDKNIWQEIDRKPPIKNTGDDYFISFVTYKKNER